MASLRNIVDDSGSKMLYQTVCSSLSTNQEACDERIVVIGPEKAPALGTVPDLEVRCKRPPATASATANSWS